MSDVEKPIITPRSSTRTCVFNNVWARDVWYSEMNERPLHQTTLKRLRTYLYKECVKSNIDSLTMGNSPGYMTMRLIAKNPSVEAEIRMMWIAFKAEDAELPDEVEI